MIPTLLLALVIVVAACGGDDPAAPTTTTTIATTTAPPPPALPPGLETLEIGETWSTEIFVGCGEFLMFNETWWAPTERNFVHPDYPADWPVEVLNMGAVDGPDARISATITLVDAATIEVRLVRGDLVAVYSPTTDIFLCG